jgi:hypothetical protein
MATAMTTIIIAGTLEDFLLQVAQATAARATAHGLMLHNHSPKVSGKYIFLIGTLVEMAATMAVTPMVTGVIAAATAPAEASPLRHLHRPHLLKAEEDSPPPQQKFLLRADIKASWGTANTITRATMLGTLI